MIAHWMRVGFVHGVMNTDNMSILGLTIDYGPYGWLDDFDLDWTPNTTDAAGPPLPLRPAAADRALEPRRSSRTRWLPAFASADPLHAGLQRYVDAYTAAERANVAAQARARGVPRRRRRADARAARAAAGGRGRHDALLPRARRRRRSTRRRSRRFGDAFYDEAKRRAAAAGVRRLAGALRARACASDRLAAAERRARMHAANPHYVLRNYLAQQAIDRAEQGDDAGIARAARRAAPALRRAAGPRARSPSAGRTGRATGPAARCCPAARSRRRSAGSALYSLNNQCR